MNDEPKTVKLVCVNGDWDAEMVICEEPLTILTGSGSNVPDALEDLASQVRLGDGDDDEDEASDDDE